MFDDIVSKARKAQTTLNASPQRLGSFPAATLDVCIAAEILRRKIKAKTTQYSGAVEVVQIRANGKSVFVIATSGDPAGLKAVLDNNNLDALAKETQQRLGSTCSFIYADSAYDFYLPLNTDFLKLFKSITPGFNPPLQWLTSNDVAKALDSVQSLVETKQMSTQQAPLSKGYRKQHDVENRANVKKIGRAHV